MDYSNPRETEFGAIWMKDVEGHLFSNIKAKSSDPSLDTVETIVTSKR